MNTKVFIPMLKCWAKFTQFVLVLVISLFIEHIARGEVVQLSITGHWSERNFKVTDRSNALYAPANPKFDGKVFGVAPSAGTTTLELLVNTDGSIFFAKGSEFIADGTGAYSLTHDFYGYRDVTLVGDTYSFGNAVWRSDGILAGLEGPDGVKAALWTDVDITKNDPTRVSLRLFGKADGLTPDLFVGSRTHASIGTQFLLWEYYKGEEIRSEKYTTKTKVLRN